MLLNLVPNPQVKMVLNPVVPKSVNLFLNPVVPKSHENLNQDFIRLFQIGEFGF